MTIAQRHTAAHRSIFFFNDTATTEIYTLSLHDALPIFHWPSLPVPLALGDPQSDSCPCGFPVLGISCLQCPASWRHVDRKSTRLNSSHANISYAVFCLKKKNNIEITHF